MHLVEHRNSIRYTVVEVVVLPERIDRQHRLPILGCVDRPSFPCFGAGECTLVGLFRWAHVEIRLYSYVLSQLVYGDSRCCSWRSKRSILLVLQARDFVVLKTDEDRETRRNTEEDKKEEYKDGPRPRG